jgi:hypothetical protein
MSNDPSQPVWANAKVYAFRVVVHTMGPVRTGSQISHNHWSIYMLSQNHTSVRLNMAHSGDPENNIGDFSVKMYEYQLTQSRVEYWDINTVEEHLAADIVRAIREKGRDKYELTSNGTGCRYWVYVSNSFRYQAPY